MKDLAEIRGLTRDQPPPPPKPNLMLVDILHVLLTPVLRAIKEAYDAGAARQKAIALEAT